MSEFGKTVSSRDLEKAVKRTLEFWIDSHLQNRELETGRDIGSVARPKTYKFVNEFDDKNPEDQTPLIAIVSPGLADQPRMEGDGTFNTLWTLGLGVILSANTRDAAEELVKDVYCPVLRQIMVQHQSLKDWADPNAEAFSGGIAWIDESYDPVVSDDANRSLFNGSLEFNIVVSQVTSRFGPIEPVAPGTDWPVVETTGVSVINLEV